MNKLAWIAVAVLIVVALALTLPALCQPGGGPPGGQGMEGPGGPGGMRGPGGPPPQPTMVVAEKGVYVIAGPNIYRLDPETLKVLAKGELPRPEPPPGADREGADGKPRQK